MPPPPILIHPTLPTPHRESHRKKKTDAPRSRSPMARGGTLLHPFDFRASAGHRRDPRHLLCRRGSLLGRHPVLAVQQHQVAVGADARPADGRPSLTSTYSTWVWRPPLLPGLPGAYPTIPQGCTPPCSLAVPCLPGRSSSQPHWLVHRAVSCRPAAPPTAASPDVLLLQPDNVDADGNLDHGDVAEARSRSRSARLRAERHTDGGTPVATGVILMPHAAAPHVVEENHRGPS